MGKKLRKCGTAIVTEVCVQRHNSDSNSEEDNEKGTCKQQNDL